MKLLTKLFRNTLSYKFFNVFATMYEYARDYGRISDVFYEDSFKLMIKRYLNVDIETDWIGRHYAVINPNIDINGKLNFNNTIIEIDGDNTNSSEYVKAWVYRQLDMVRDLFKLHSLYDYIYMDLKHVGPINHDNYLVVFDMVSRINFATALKSFAKHTILYIMIALLIWACL